MLEQTQHPLDTDTIQPTDLARIKMTKENKRKKIKEGNMHFQVLAM